MWDLSGLRSAGTPARRLLTDPGPDGLGPVRDAVADPWFVGAIAWQNPDLVRDWLGARHRAALAGKPVPAPKASHQRILGAYLQRYAAKNDVIGFSGPTCAARWSDDARQPLLVRPGPDITGPPRVRYEPWALSLLVDTWAARPSLRWHMPVARDRSSMVHEGRCFRSAGPHDLTLPQAEIHRRADGLRSAAQLFEELAGLGLAQDRNSFTAVLTELTGLGIVDWRFPVPLDHRPEAALRDRIARIPDADVRTELLDALDRLDAGRAELGRLATAGPDPLPLTEAMAALDAEFASLTGESARRHATGRRTGHGRRLVYLDTTRDVEVVIGPELRAALVEPLGLLLDSARWLTARVADLVRETLGAALDRHGPEPLPLLAAYPDVRAALDNEPGGGLRALFDELRHRWAGILAASPDQRRVDLDASEVADRVRTAFAATDYGWAAARQHSPDLMLAVDRWEDGRPTDFRWVLGELHLGVNTLENRVFVTGQPDADVLEASVAEDFAGGRVVSTFDRTSPEFNARVYPPLSFDLPDRYQHWAWHATDTLPPERDRIPGAALWLYRNRHGRLQVFSVEREFKADAVEMLGEFLSGCVAEHFGVLPADWTHLPRVTIGRLVVVRETWRIPAQELTGTADLAALGVPRHSFAIVPGEAKPILVDLESRVSALQVARSVRRALEANPDASVTVSEMLPDFDQLWLHDAQGQRYTSELRLVAVDTTPHDQVLPCR